MSRGKAAHKRERKRRHERQIAAGERVRRERIRKPFDSGQRMVIVRRVPHNLQHRAGDCADGLRTGKGSSDMSTEDIIENWLNFESQLAIIKTAFVNQHFQEAYKEAERLSKFLRIFAVREKTKEEEKKNGR